MDRLTENEGIFAVNHLYYLYGFLKAKHYKLVDYFDIAVFGYLKAVKDYLNQPDLRRYALIIRRALYNHRVF